LTASGILLLFALAFVLAAGLRRVRRGTFGSQGRTWLLVAFIFMVVATWLLRFR
jgi:hypothetical protein